jgi:hypothetical protein
MLLVDESIAPTCHCLVDRILPGAGTPLGGVAYNLWGQHVCTERQDGKLSIGHLGI